MPTWVHPSACSHARNAISSRVVVLNVRICFLHLPFGICVNRQATTVA